MTGSQAIAYDRWRIDLMKKELGKIDSDLPLIEWGQGFRDMAPALDALEAELLNERVNHGNHPVLRMCAANAIVVKDPAGSRKLDKSRATGRIDGLQAMAQAFGIAARSVAAQDVYPDGQFLFI
ncbi:terminase TerL endonuclease subunit [Rhodoferax antarcticus]|uniref:Phage Terminase n=2 Tax=Rhodoferax antarcticus TaxID=81479 RepID=A0A1Q8YC85_9BURK|nr:phage Terminase [Rhodoferax antarcticus ANT.BR]